MSLVLGPLALPFVWLSKVLSLGAKLVYTVVLGALGFYLVYGLWQAAHLVNQSFQMISTF